MPSNRLYIYIDGWCPYCRRFGRWVERMDIFHQISIRDIRTDNSSEINREQALKAMASINGKGEVVYGFSTIYRIFQTVPLLWVFFPIFILLKLLHIGDFLYHELAIRRKIIPLHCDESSCSLY